MKTKGSKEDRTFRLKLFAYAILHSTNRLCATQVGWLPLIPLYGSDEARIKYTYIPFVRRKLGRHDLQRQT